MNNYKRIKEKDIKEGDKLRVIGNYWSSSNDCQETEYFLTFENGKFLENGKEFFFGINSSYEFYLPK